MVPASLCAPAQPKLSQEGSAPCSETGAAPARHHQPHRMVTKQTPGRRLTGTVPEISILMTCRPFCTYQKCHSVLPSLLHFYLKYTLIEARSYNSALFLNFFSSAIEKKTNGNKTHFHSNFTAPDSLQQLIPLITFFLWVMSSSL